MKTSSIYEQLVHELRNILNSEKLVIEFLPLFIEASTSEEIKNALKKNLKESKNQLSRVEKILAILGLKTHESDAHESIKNVFEGVQEIVAGSAKSSNLDIIIISASQKVNQFEIVCYSTLENCAKDLNFNSEIIALINDSYNEQCAFDKKLQILESSLNYEEITL